MMRCPVCNGDALVRDASVPVLGNRPCDACRGSGEVDSWKMVAASSLVARWERNRLRDHARRSHPPGAAIRIASGEEVVASISGQVRAIAWIGGVVPGILLGTTAAAASVQWPAIAIPVIGANFALGLTILIRAAVHPDRFLATWRRHARLQNITPTPPAGRAER